MALAGRRHSARRDRQRRRFCRVRTPAITASTQLARLEHDFRPEQAGPETTVLVQQLDEYFAGTRRTLDWTLDDRLMRSDFQRRVLRATAAIPYGTVISYQGLADTIGQPRAVRAVAQALRHNPVPLHIPCHRVLGSDGRLTGYAGNLVETKRAILETEGIPVRHTRRGLAIAAARMYVGWRSRSSPVSARLRRPARSDRRRTGVDPVPGPGP